MGLHGSITRFYYEWPPAERGKKLFSLWLANNLSALIGLAFFYLLGRSIFKYIWPNIEYIYIELSIFIAFTIYMCNFPMLLIRAKDEAILYASFTILVALFIVALRFLFVVKKGEQALGFLKSDLIANTSVFALLSIYMLKHIKPGFDLVEVRKAFRFVAPTIPAMMLRNVASRFDQFLLEKFISLDTIGIYSLGRRVGLLIEMVSAALRNSWAPMVNRIVFQEKQYINQIPNLGLMFFIVVASAASLVAFFPQEIITFLGKERFKEAYYFVPFFSLISLIMSFYYVTGVGIGISKKTEYLLLISVVNLAYTTTVGYPLVRIFGVWGAVVLPLSSTILNSALVYRFSMKFWPLNYKVKEMLFLTLLCISFAAVGTTWGSYTPQNALLKISIFILFWLPMYTIAINNMKTSPLLKGKEN